MMHHTCVGCLKPMRATVNKTCKRPACLAAARRLTESLHWSVSQRERWRAYWQQRGVI